MTLLIFVKDVTLITVFTIRKYLEGKENPKMRPNPGSGQILADKDAFFNIRPYLLDPNDEGIDEEGNTSIHHLTKFNDISLFEQQLLNQPQLLFMLNREGLTSLDVAVQEKDEGKALYLVQRMKGFSPNCSFKFVKRPNRLEVKYEKAFVLAV